MTISEKLKGFITPKFDSDYYDEKDVYNDRYDERDYTDDDYEYAEGVYDIKDGRRTRDIYASAHEPLEREKDLRHTVATGTMTEVMPGPSLVHLKPLTIDDTLDVPEYLKQRKIVHVNMQETPGADGQRIADFISGIACALNGTVNKLGEKLYVVMPEGGEISDQDKETLKSAAGFLGLGKRDKKLDKSIGLFR